MLAACLYRPDIAPHQVLIEKGDLLLPSGAGWGADVDKALVRAHPPRKIFR